MMKRVVRRIVQNGGHIDGKLVYSYVVLLIRSAVIAVYGVVRNRPLLVVVIDRKGKAVRSRNVCGGVAVFAYVGREFIVSCGVVEFAYRESSVVVRGHESVDSVEISADINFTVTVIEREVRIVAVVFEDVRRRLVGIERQIVYDFGNGNLLFTDFELEFLGVGILLRALPIEVGGVRRETYGYGVHVHLRSGESPSDVCSAHGVVIARHILAIIGIIRRVFYFDVGVIDALRLYYFAVNKYVIRRAEIVDDYIVLNVCGYRLTADFRLVVLILRVQIGKRNVYRKLFYHKLVVLFRAAVPCVIVSIGKTYSQMVSSGVLGKISEYLLVVRL